MRQLLTLTPARSRRLSAEKGARPPEQRPLAVATVNQYLKLLKAIYNRAIRAGRLIYNPVSAVKLYQERSTTPGIGA